MEEPQGILDGMYECLMPSLERAKIYLWTGMRPKWSTDAIAGIIEYGMKKDPYSGDIYLFRSALKTTVYAYRWSGNGWCEWKKKSMTDRPYYWPKDGEQHWQEITAAELHLMLRGINIWKQFQTYDGQKIQ